MNILTAANHRIGPKDGELITALKARYDSPAGRPSPPPAPPRRVFLFCECMRVCWSMLVWGVACCVRACVAQAIKFPWWFPWSSDF